MIRPADALAGLPDGLREPLLAEYQSIISNYFEGRWSPSELSGGKFCEIVYTILDGYARKNHASTPSKPTNFVAACRALEAHAHVPRSFQILIPRLLPALYEIRNNRGVGHVGGDVDPNHMDAVAVVSNASWVLAEIVRVMHHVPVDEASALVEGLVERRIPLVWQQADLKRVLKTGLQLKAEVLLLLSSGSGMVKVADLMRWTDYSDQKYFLRLLRSMHRTRLIEFHESVDEVQLLPPGAVQAERIARSHSGRLASGKERSKKRTVRHRN